MTIEEKARAYERTRDFIEKQNPPAFDKDLIGTIFPELQESEGERIRKAIIGFVKYKAQESLKDKWIAWLEKQGEKKNKINITFEDVLALECSMKTAKITKGGDELYKILVPLYNKIHNAYLEKQEKQKPKFGDDENSNVNEGTNAPTEYGKYVDECLNEASKHFFSEGEDKYSVADLFYAGVRCGKSWFEKQQKSADKVEPKFKVGDWVVISTSDEEKVVQIDSIEYFKSGEPRYITSEGRWFGNGTKAHLWTIQDAKDGDVLTTYDIQGNIEWLFLYMPNKHKLRINDPRFYCHYDLKSDSFKKDNDYVSVALGTKFCPATKEQRNFLFQKMREAGYEFKVPTWSEEDEKMFRSLHNLIYVVSDCDCDSMKKKELSDWLKSLKQRMEE